MSSGLLDTTFASNLETVEKKEESFLRSKVAENPLNFQAWLDLVKHIESYKDPALNLEIYERILKEYPLCYGFWRKMADIYAVQGEEALVVKTYERSFEFLPVCVELWTAYCAWASSKKSEEQARELFERAAVACGSVFKSGLFWEKYIEFEKSKKRFENVGTLYWRLLQFPTDKLHDYYRRFKLFMDAKGRKMEHYGSSLPNKVEDYPFETEDARNIYADFAAKADMFYSSRCELVRSQRFTEIQQAYHSTLEEFNARRVFEQKIKRTFFHAKALDEEQLANWRAYLDFEESQKDFSKIDLLYKRCVCALCFYPEFWVRYGSFLESSKGEEAARQLYIEANKKFMFRRPDLFIAQGRFEETHGNFEEAKKLYSYVMQDLCPGLFEALYLLLDLEKRMGQTGKVEFLYKEAIRIAQDSNQDALIAFAYSKFASYLRMLGRYQESTQILEESLKNSFSRKSLFLAYIQSLRHLPTQERLQLTKDTYEQAVSEGSKLSAKDKEDMWILFLDFMRDMWPSIEDLREVEERYASLNPLAIPYRSNYEF